MTRTVDSTEQLVAEILVADIGRSATFYRDLGFELLRDGGDFQELAWEGHLLFLVTRAAVYGPRGGARPAPIDLPAANVRVMVPDVDACWRRAAAIGARVVAPLADRDYGLRDFTIADPDGFGVRFASALGRDAGARAEIAVHDGDRAALLPLFRMADDSVQAVDAYYRQGAALVATNRGAIVGLVQMIADDGDPATWELKSIAVLEAHRQGGLGRALAEAGIAHARRHGARRIVVGTGAADTGPLRFYQRVGFRMTRIERDAYGPAAGYPPNLLVEGIPLRDRVWLELD
jgi:ribosomal protein S18 acetylase RimI-like enzyme